MHCSSITYYTFYTGATWSLIHHFGPFSWASKVIGLDEMHCNDAELQPVCLSANSESIALGMEGHCHSGDSERRVHVAIIHYRESSSVVAVKKTNVLTVLLHLNSANKESEDEQIWLRGTTGWWGYNVSVSLLLCVFHHSRDAASVVWWAWASSSKPHSDSLHYFDSISIRPPIKSPGEPLDVTCC